MDKAAKKVIIRRSEEEKLALIEKWEQSGLPISVFCNQHGFSDSLFHTWLNKYRRNKRKAKSTGAFIPIQLPTADSSTQNTTTPFADLTLAKGHQITLYQVVPAEYLSALLS